MTIVHILEACEQVAHPQGPTSLRLENKVHANEQGTAEGSPKGLSGDAGITSI